MNNEWIMNVKKGSPTWKTRAHKWAKYRWEGAIDEEETLIQSIISSNYFLVSDHRDMT